MNRDSYRGKFIVFEGIDGAGKSTQLKLLTTHLKKEGYKVKILDFPQYGKKSAGMVEEYLAGTFGSLKEVGPYEASIFYAVDRYDMSFQIREWLKQRIIVVSDHYVGSNIGHQGSKIANRGERAKYFKWLFDLEYGILKIPKPDKIFFLNIPAEIAQKLCNNSERRKKKKSDLHEENLEHLKNASLSYLHAASLYQNDFVVVEEMKGSRLLSPEEIHETVWRGIKKIL